MAQAKFAQSVERFERAVVWVEFQSLTGREPVNWIVLLVRAGGRLLHDDASLTALPYGLKTFSASHRTILGAKAVDCCRAQPLHHAGNEAVVVETRTTALVRSGHRPADALPQKNDGGFPNVLDQVSQPLSVCR